jgi:Protein of unknown function (DUF3300)
LTVHRLPSLLAQWCRKQGVNEPDEGAPQALLESPEQIRQLVAPIALYPDRLVAQIRAAAPYPTEIIGAENWLQHHKDLQGEKLAKEVNKQHWDPSVEALTQFPAVLANKSKPRMDIGTGRRLYQPRATGESGKFNLCVRRPKVPAI